MIKEFNVDQYEHHYISPANLSSALALSIIAYLIKVSFQSDKGLMIIDQLEGIFGPLIRPRSTAMCLLYGCAGRSVEKHLR